jgi:hypothetical protein
MINMKEITERDTAVLLAALDRDIDIKCMELKEKQAQIRLKNIFFSSCIFIFFSFLIQLFFKVFNLNFITAIILYQALILILFIPFIPNLSKGVILK